MALPEREEMLALARELVGASPADETEVAIEARTERYVRYAGSGPTQSADRERCEVAIRVRLAAPEGLREARATCDGVDESLTRAALERALALARVSPASTDLAPLGGPVEIAARDADAATREHPFAEKARWVSGAIEACRAAELAPAGLAQTGALSLAIANSAGRAVHAARSRASFSLTASEPSFAGAAGFAQEIAARVEAIDPSRVARRAVEKALRGRDAQRIDTGEYTVVLEPPAVSALLLFTSYKGFGAQEVHEKSSFLCGRIGQRVFAECFSMEDDAGSALHPGLPFDREGAPSRRVPLVERGVLRGPVTDANWARRLGVENTGHALPMPNSHGPRALNLCVAPGDASLDELIGGVERGLFVSQFHYVNLIDARDLSLTGVTRNGTFLIEGGRVTRPVRDLRFTQSLVSALARVTGVGRELEVAGALFDGELVCPALRIERFRFTSTA